MNGLHIEQRIYAGHWPIWVMVKDGAVIQCFLTEDEAEEAMK